MKDVYKNKRWLRLLIAGAVLCVSLVILGFGWRVLSDCPTALDGRFGWYRRDDDSLRITPETVWVSSGAGYERLKYTYGSGWVDCGDVRLRLIGGDSVWRSDVAKVYLYIGEAIDA